MADRLQDDLRMKLLKFAILIPVAAAGVLAESQTHTYTGDIVSANCFQAAAIVNRNSRGYTPAGVNTFAGSRYKPLKTEGLRKSILRHCTVNPGTTQFALIDDQGNFLPLNETGNREVISRTPSYVKKIHVTITGSVDRERLIVQSLSID
jgi:hypothetical protein